MTAPGVKWPGRRPPLAGQPVPLGKCSTSFTSCTPMGAMPFAQSATASTGQRDARRTRPFREHIRPRCLLPATPRAVPRCLAVSPLTRQKSLPAHDDDGPSSRQHRMHGNDIFRNRSDRHAGQRLPHVADVASVRPLAAARGTEVIQVTPGTPPEARATSNLITTLRDHVIPAAEHGTTLRVYVGGSTATFSDFATLVTSKLPWFILAIVGLSFLLLVLAFRSLLVPATAAVMNLLAAAASFGVLVAFFQWGWGSDALGLGNAGPIEAFLPPITLAILFGLSMDYQVFLVSRINEEWVCSRNSRRAVRTGQTQTARVITAAATIMICVFLAFALTGQRDIAEFGISLAAAVALDAFILRTVLVPAAMHLFGDANWWLPRWKDRLLPHLAIEPPKDTPAPPAPTVPALR